MTFYIYLVKCPDCEDEQFEFFDQARECAMGRLGQKPIITQTMIDRNDFGECTNSEDLGQVWSWEDEAKVTEDDPAISVFTKGHFNKDAADPEFDNIDNSVDYEPTEDEIETDFHSEDSLDRVPDNFRKPIPEGMTIEQLVEEMEENEDTVECVWCNDLFDKSECRKEADMGWLCPRCEAAIKSRGETLTFTEDLESLDEAYQFSYLADIPDAREQILLRAYQDPAAQPYINDLDFTIKPARATLTGSSTPVGNVTDVYVDGQVIKVILDRGASKSNELELEQLMRAGFFNKNLQKGCPAHNLLSAIKEAAKSLKPTRAEATAKKQAGFDKAVLAMLQSNPAVADELKEHITDIEFVVPMQDDYEFYLDSNDPDYEAAVDKLNKLYDNFMKLPFAQDALNAGLVTSRALRASDHVWHIKQRWQLSCPISFDCPIGKLSPAAKQIIEDAKVIAMSKDGGTADLTNATTANCYRLAVALITYFDGDVLFFTKKTGVTESFTNEKLWYCVYDGRDVGTVTAASAHEALDKMQQEYPEYNYGLYDGCFWVEPADEE